jgi:tape measure domain-containing protein
MTVHTTSIRYETQGVNRTTGEVIQLSNALGRLEGKGPALERSARTAAAGVNALDGGLNALGARLGQVGGRIDPLNTRFNRLSRAQADAGASAGALAIAMGVTAGAASAYGLTLVTLADKYAALQGRIRIYAASAGEAARTEAALFAAARETRSAVEPMVALYSRLQPAFADMGRSQQDTIRFTTLVSKALATQGATTQETQAATVQLAQALASGVLRGDEFRSLMEASPGLMRNVALGMGVPVGALRALAEEGKLTADVVIGAIERMSERIEGDFAKAPKTVGQAWQVLQDSIMRVVGMEAQATGAQGALADALLAVADAADEVAAAVKLAVQAGLTLGAVVMIAGLVKWIGHLKAVGAAAQEAAQKVRAAQSLSAMGQAGAAAIAGSAEGAAALNAARAAEAQTRIVQQQAEAIKRATKEISKDLMVTQNVSRDTARELAVAHVTANREALLAANAVGQVAQAFRRGADDTTLMGLATRAAGNAMNVLRGAAGSLMAFMGGPWGVAVAAAVAALMAFQWWTDKARHAQNGFAQALAATETMVKAYQKAVEQANKASGEARQRALENAQAQRTEAMAYYQKAQAAVAAAKVQAATSRAQAASLMQSQGSFGLDPTMSGLGAAVVDQANANRLAQMEGALKAAEQALEQMGATINRLPRGQTSVRFGDVIEPARTTSGPPAASSGSSSGDSAADKARREAEQLAERVADARAKISAEALQLERQALEEALRGQEDAQRRHLARYERMSKEGNQAAAQASVEAYERAGSEIQTLRDQLHQLALRQLRAETDAQKAELAERLKGAKELASLLEEVERQHQAKVQAAQRSSGTIVVGDRDPMAEAQERALKEMLEKVRQENRRFYEAGDGIGRALRDGVLNGGNWESVGEQIGRTILETLYDRLIGDPLNEMIRNWIDQLLMPKSDGGRSSGGVLSAIGSVLGLFGGGSAGARSGSAGVNTRQISGSVSFSPRPQIAGGRAGGGDVSPGVFYRVNEDQQEFFMPRRDGAIWTPRQLGALAGSGASARETVVNIHNHTGVTPTVRRTRGADGFEQVDVLLREVVEGMARGGDLHGPMGLPRSVPVQG